MSLCVCVCVCVCVCGMYVYIYNCKNVFVFKYLNSVMCLSLKKLMKYDVYS